MISPQPQGGSGYNDLAAEKKMAVTLEKNLHHDQASDYVTYDHVAETIVEMGHPIHPKTSLRMYGKSHQASWPELSSSGSIPGSLVKTFSVRPVLISVIPTAGLRLSSGKPVR